MTEPLIDRGPRVLLSDEASQYVVLVADDRLADYFRAFVTTRETELIRVERIDNSNNSSLNSCELLEPQRPSLNALCKSIREPCSPRLEDRVSQLEPLQELPVTERSKTCDSSIWLGVVDNSLPNLMLLGCCYT